MNDTKKTEAQKQLIKFRERFHKLLIKYPDIQVVGSLDGDPMAMMQDEYGKFHEIYLPTNGKQELIKH